MSEEICPCTPSEQDAKQFLSLRGGWTAFDQLPMLKWSLFFEMMKIGNVGVGVERTVAFGLCDATRNTPRASRIPLLFKDNR
jgi:hypothetical protein